MCAFLVGERLGSIGALKVVPAMNTNRHTIQEQGLYDDGSKWSPWTNSHIEGLYVLPTHAVYITEIGWSLDGHSRSGALVAQLHCSLSFTHS